MEAPTFFLLVILFVSVQASPATTKPKTSSPLLSTTPMTNTSNSTEGSSITMKPNINSTEASPAASNPKSNSPLPSPATTKPKTGSPLPSSTPMTNTSNSSEVSSTTMEPNNSSINASSITMEPDFNSTGVTESINSSTEASSITMEPDFNSTGVMESINSSTEVPLTTQMTPRYPSVTMGERIVDSRKYGEVMDIKCPGNHFAFKEVHFGYQRANMTSCEKESLCWSTNEFWSFMENEAPQNCSGKDACKFQATWQQDQHLKSTTPECEGANQTSCYQKLEGVCLYEEKKVNFCEKQNISGSSIYLHSPGLSSDRFNDYECECTVQSQQNIHLDAVLFTLSFNENENCTASFEIDDGNTTDTLSCNDSLKFVNLKSDSKKLNLKLTQPFYHPYQIWLKVHTKNDMKVTVDCKEKKYLVNMTTMTPTSMMTTISLKEISRMQEENTKEFLYWIGGSVGGVIMLIIIIITVVTHRRFKNMADNVKKRPKTPNDAPQKKNSIDLLPTSAKPNEYTIFE